MIRKILKERGVLVKQNKISFLLFGILSFAAFLGLYAESIACFFEKYLHYMDPLKMIIIVIIISIVLFILVFVTALILLIMEKLAPKIFVVLLITNIVIGIPATIWSLFVLAMGWG